jgi:predicted DNA-binding transcriptional regulator YafY
MAKKRKTPTKPTSAASVTPERFLRLHRLVRLLATGPQTREVIARRLRLDVRGFYRDLDLLRSSGVAVSLDAGRYTLNQSETDALSRLPFPDPRLTLGEAQSLAKGRGPAQRALAESIARVLAS